MSKLRIRVEQDFYDELLNITIKEVDETTINNIITKILNELTNKPTPDKPTI